MARTKKGDEKNKDGATISIDVDSFVRTRDSVRPFHCFPCVIGACLALRTTGLHVVKYLAGSNNVLGARHGRHPPLPRLTRAISGSPRPRDRKTGGRVTIDLVGPVNAAARLCCLFSVLASMQQPQRRVQASPAWPGKHSSFSMINC